MCKMDEETLAFALASHLGRCMGPTRCRRRRPSSPGAGRPHDDRGYRALHLRRGRRSRHRGVASGALRAVTGNRCTCSPSRGFDSTLVLCTLEGANSAYKRPVEPHLAQNASSFRSVCPAPISEWKSERATRLAGRHLRSRAPSAVRRKVPRGRGPAPRAGRCSRRAPCPGHRPEHRRGPCPARTHPRPLYLTGSPQNSSTRRRWDALNLHVSNLMNIWLFPKNPS